MVTIVGSLQVQGLGGAVEAMDLAAVERGEERGVVGGDEVDELEFEGFCVAVGFGVADGVFGGFDVAAAAAGVGAEEGCGVVLDLLLEDGVELAAFDDGVGGAGVGAGSHGGDVGGFEEEEAGGAGAAAGGRDEDDDRDGGVFDGLDHDAGRFEQATGGAHGDEDQLRVLAGGFLEAALEVVGGDGLDGVVDGEFDDDGLWWLARQRRLQASRQDEGRQECDETSFEEVPHGRLCPRACRACLIPRAAESLGSSWSALLTLEAEAASSLACRSRRASTR